MTSHLKKCTSNIVLRFVKCILVFNDKHKLPNFATVRERQTYCKSYVKSVLYVLLLVQTDHPQSTLSRNKKRKVFFYVKIFISSF